MPHRPPAPRPLRREPPSPADGCGAAGRDRGAGPAARRRRPVPIAVPLAILVAVLIAVVAGTPPDPAAAQIPAAETILTIGSGSPPPFSSPDGIGYYDRLIPLLFARVGLQARVAHLPSERSWDEARSGDLDGDTPRVPDAAASSPELVMVPEPVFDARRFMAFAGPGLRIDTITWEGLAAYHVGYVRGWKIFENRVSGRSVSPAETLEQLFTLLGKGRIDLALCGYEDGRLMARTQGLTGVRPLEPPLSSTPMYLFLNRRHAALAEPLADALRAMRADGELDRLLRQAEAAAVEP